MLVPCLDCCWCFLYFGVGFWVLITWLIMLREFGFGVLRDRVVFDLFMLVLFVAFELVWGWYLVFGLLDCLVYLPVCRFILFCCALVDWLLVW